MGDNPGEYYYGNFKDGEKKFNLFNDSDVDVYDVELHRRIPEYVDGTIPNPICSRVTGDH